MAGLTFTGQNPYTTTTGVTNTGWIAAGTTRWNTTTSQMEVFDGQQWTVLGAGEVKDVTLADMVQYAEDQVATQIELEYADNATILDAYKTWEAANERFRVILALAEKK